MYRQAPKAAAVAAGYQTWAGAQTAQALLRKPHIQQALAERRAARGGPVSRAALLEELSRVAMSNVLDYARVVDGRLTLDLSQLDRARAAGVRELTVTESWDPRTGSHHATTRVRLGLKLQAARLLLPLLPPDDGASRGDAAAPGEGEGTLGAASRKPAGEALAAARKTWPRQASNPPQIDIDPAPRAT